MSGSTGLTLGPLFFGPDQVDQTGPGKGLKVGLDESNHAIVWPYAYGLAGVYSIYGLSYLDIGESSTDAWTNYLTCNWCITTAPQCLM